MRKLARVFSLCTLLLSMVLFSACYKTVDINQIDKKKNIALILKMNTGYYWGAIKQGADIAAKEFNVNILYNAPQEEDDVAEQIQLVNQALEEKVDALILDASDYHALAEVVEKAHSLRIPTVIIDSEVNTKKIRSYIATDNLDAGKKAGESLVKIVGPKARVAIMSFVKGNRNAALREEGLMSVISKYEDIQVVAKEYCSSDSHIAYNLTREIMARYGPVDAIVALNSTSSEGVAEAVDYMGLGQQVKIVSFDNTLKEIDYLEKGIIQATITQNPFNMGYLGVKYTVEAMKGKSVPPITYTDSKVIYKEDIYLPENQKLLFPFVK